MTALIEQTFSVFNIKFEVASDDIPVNREFYSKVTYNEDGRSLMGHASCVPSVERKASKSDRSIMKSTTLPCQQTTFSKFDTELYIALQKFLFRMRILPMYTCQLQMHFRCFPSCCQGFSPATGHFQKNDCIKNFIVFLR